MSNKKSTGIKDIYELTPMQEGMLYHSLLDKESNAYFEQMCFTLKGVLDRCYLEKSLYQLIERYDIFRTAFIHEKVDRPVQVVLKQPRVDLYFEDITNLAEEAKKTYVEEFKIKDKVNGIDLTKGSPLRLAVIKTGDNVYELIWSFHHIIMDGWCIGIVFKEFMEIYESVKDNRLLALGDIYPYSDYIKWLKKQDREEALCYWEEYLGGYAEQASLLQNISTKTGVKYEQQELKFKIDEHLVKNLNEMITKNSVTLNTIIQTLWGIVLQRYNNTNDVVFGAVVSGRPHEIPGIESMVGLFINTIPVRIQCGGNQLFSELLKEVQESSVQGNRYSYCPLAEIQSKTDLKYNLFDHIMVFENYPVEEEVKSSEEVASSELDLIDFESFEQTNYDFNVIVALGTALYITFSYNGSVYSKSTVENIKEYFMTAFKRIVDYPEILVKDIDILTEEERNRILYDFNNTKTEYPKDKTIQKLFEEQADQNPNKIAIVFEDQQLTYGELNEKANQLARVLRDKGVGTEKIVGIMVERSLEMVVGTLGILKAGGAYLPIDPKYPLERINYILKDSQATVLLTHGSVDIVDGKIIQKIHLEDHELYNGSMSNLEAVNTANSLAYVMYTSGSTGKPKGVMVEHKNVIRLVKNPNYIKFQKEDRILQTGAIVFDATTFELWGALLNGLELYIVGEEVILDADKLSHSINKFHITTMWLTSSLFNQHSGSKPEMFINIRNLLVGGDVLSPKHINAVKKLCKNTTIINGYGPTENTTFSTCFTIDREHEANIPIGKPVSNSTAYIIDSDNRLQAIGIVGELCVGGDGIARGYLNNPKLTEGKFVENPIVPGERMYRTGDLARWLPDGNIEFLGRIDYQVKVRGFRIEMGEIESQLLKHPQVKEAVVVAKEDPQGNNYLCAYFVGERELTTAHLREHLEKDLPEYMIPSFFIQLERMPLTSNGKVNRKTLPEPDGSMDTGVEFVEPVGEIEEKLVKMWQEILGRERVGTRDNFFDLGGHSLKATALVSRIHKEYDVEFPLREVFKTPTIAEMASYIKGAQKSIYSAVQPVGQQEYYPMSSAQKRLYIMDQLGSTKTAYNIPLILVVEGKLDKERFVESFQQLVRRHETLRTSFTMIDGEPVQKVQQEVDFKITYLEATEEEAKEMVKEFIKPFDLGKACLLRVSLIKIADDRHLMLFDMHHIISDGTSMNLLIQEFISLYEGKRLKELRLQYKDYSVWQKQLYARQVFKKQEAYWLETFKGEIPVLSMPLDYSRPAIQSYEGAITRFAINKELAEKLYRLTKDAKATLYMTLLAVFNILLSKYTGQDDIVIGSPISGRPHDDFQNIIGMFVNTLAMRNHPQGEKTFSEFLYEVRENALKAYENQEYPFEELVEKLDIKRDLSRNALFDVMFVLQNTDMSDEEEITELKFIPYQSQHNTAQFDLTLNAIEFGSGIAFSLEYCTKLYKKETIERLKGHYIRILEQIAENPAIRINDIEVLSKNERDMLIYEYNDTQAKYPREKTIQELFEQQAEQKPENVAVVFENHHLTYRELNEKANQLARVLRHKGVGPDSIVAIMMQRSLEMIIGIFGVLKAGGAYLPIDPQYPEDRIGYMLNDSKAKLLLVQQRYQNRIPFQGETLDLEDPNLYEGDGKNLELINTSRDLAYVIYTSGSTGKPKGVMIEHYSVINRLNWMQRQYPIGVEDVIIQKTPYTFDVSVWELFWWSFVGAKVCLLVPGGEKDPEEIIRAIEQNRVTTMHFVPSMLNTFLGYIEESADSDRLLSLKQVFASGEALNKEQVKRFTEAISNRFGTVLINLYGPTEATVDVSYFNCNNAQGYETVPIGKPIDNIQLYVINVDNQLCPLGVNGELCIGGDGLARGYLNNPELTNEKFVANPFATGGRIYRTGDLARRLPDGNIEYLGRIDHQVKVRGFRIELGEIESQLLKHPQIKETVVVAKDDSQGSKYLCAYLVGEAELTTAQLREYLAKELPDYMIPSYFIQLDRLPLTANGKVNRKALPEPDGNINTGVAYVAPAGETEAKLAVLWQEILGVEKVGTRDNFFELGGHSLKATILVSRIHKECNVQIPLREIFKTPTIKAMARYIEDAQESIYASIQPVGEREYYPLSSAQKRLYILDQLEGASTAYNMPMLMSVEGGLDRERFETAFQQLVKRHETLRTSFTMNDGEPVQKIHQEVDFKVTYLEATEESAREMAQKFIQPFDLKKGCLLRVCLIKLGEERHRLLFDMHHIISDGISMNLLIQEFTRLYEGEGLEELRIQYKDYAVWQQGLYDGKIIKQQEEYWLETFKGEVPVLNLPLDYPRPALQSFEGDSIGFVIGKERAEKLNQIAREQKATLYMTLLAAFNVLLSKYTSQEDIVIGSPIAGRPHADLQNIIGMFVNTLAMRNYPQGEKTFSEFLKEVRENALKAYENQDYPFEALVEKLDIKRDMSRNALFDVMFTAQNLERAENESEMSEIEFTSYESPLRIAKFDLTLSAIEFKEGIAFGLEYCTKLFKKETIERLIEHYINILEQVTENPGIQLKDIDMLSEEERNRILFDFNNTEAEYPKTKTIQELFEEQTVKTPDKIAVVFEEQRLTYRELNEKANQLARILRDKGVRPDSIVALMVERSLEMIVGILGILKAGGAYLPINPEYPEERIKFILEDSRVKVLLVQSYLKKGCGFDQEIIDINNLDSPLEDTDNIEVINQPNDLAYVVYTSGTTGKPKGVLIEHTSVINLVYGLNKAIYHRYGSQLKVTLLAPYVFDASVQQIFASLLLGHQLFIVPEEVRANGEELIQYYLNNGIDISDGTPVHLNMLLNANIETYGQIKVKHFIIGGETLSSKTTKDFLAKFHINKPYITNVYGPTECCVDATAFLIENEEQIGIKTVPIGRPLTNTRIFILDKNMKVVPQGVAGEIYISGAGLSRGYLNRSELTEEKFVSTPFALGEQMYRTGDVAKWLPDGNIEFLGRLDHQVKVRGFRIELGEIESQLLKHPQVKETLVVAKEDPQGSKYLCAYLVAEEDLPVTGLRDFLAKELPDYMIPLYYIRLEKMPLTPNGKIDQKALPEPDGSIITGVEYVAPVDEVEERLTILWQEVLGVQKVGTKDKFFDLGGHSLKATNLVSRIHKEFSVEYPLREVFKAPTISEMARFIKSTQESPYSAIEPVEEREYYPMSSAQKRLYILDQLEGASAAYNMPLFMLTEGALDRVGLEEAFRQLVKRHESLRTTFAMIDGEPVQRVHLQMDFGFTYLEATDAEADKIAKEFIKPFDLTKGPLLRVCLVKTSENRHMLLFDMHHIISDGISMNLLMHEFASLYEGAKLPELKIQYKDYAIWQKRLYSGEVIKQQEAYWLDTFKGEVPVLNMPLDYPRPSFQSFQGDSMGFGIRKELTEKLNEISKETGATLFMTLLAAFNILLSKYTSQEDIVIGTPIAGRNHADLQNIIGMFVNTLAMRNYPQGEKTFRGFLKEVKENALKAYENQNYPFEELVGKLDIKRDLSRNALFDVMFEFQNLNISDSETETETASASLKLAPYKSPIHISKFDLTLSATETEKGIAFCLEFCTKLFKEETIKRLMMHFLNILERVTENPSIRLKDIDILTEEERNKIIYEFNNTHQDFPDTLTVHHYLEKHSGLTPERTAVVYKEETYTYRQINQTANQIARLLRKTGVNAGEPVAVLLDRSPLLVQAILGIWKAGGAYLPIDPGYPVARIAVLLEESKVQVVLSLSEHIAPELKAAYKGQILCFDTIKAEMDAQGNGNLNLEVAPQGLAYVIYTSGSTGRPKGAMIEHLGMMNHIQMEMNELRISENSIIAQNASHCFDVSVWQFFAALCAGGKIVIYPNETVMDVQSFTEKIEADGVTILEVVPSFLRMVIESIKEKDLRLEKLEYLLATGEIVTPGLVGEWFALNPSTKVVNAYGPAEAADDVTQHMMEAAPTSENIPIGRPIQNMHIYIVDSNMNLCPVGVKGEICVSGIGVGRGYLNDPEKTAKVFMADPFRGADQIRLYKTGDLGRWLPDGQLEFCGRKDFQVKVRGYRIELGEVENCLLKHPLIKETVVVSKVDFQGNKYLCAYFAGEEKLTTVELREHLSRDLPDYMIPVYFVRLEKIPLNPNGKIDRKALPEPDGTIDTGVEYIAPRNEKEEILVRVWEEVLKGERIGILDNFFSLGGDSIKAIQILSRLNNYGLKLELKDLFNNPVIESLSGNVKIATRVIEQGPVQGEVKLTPEQRWLFSQEFSEKHHYNQDMMLFSEGGFDAEILRKVISKMVEHHDALRMVYQIRGNEVVQYNRGLSGELYSLEIIDFSNNENYRKEITKEADRIQRSIDLENGPLLKAGLFKTKDGDHLLIVIHHLIVDGVSWRILLEDLTYGYTKASNNEAFQFVNKTDSFKDWADKQSAYANSKEMLKEIAYWKNLEEAEIKPLPKERGINEKRFKDNENILMELTADETEKLLTKVNNAYTTEINDILLTALGLAVKEWTGEDKVLIQLEGHGREEIIKEMDICRTVGWFTSEYPVVLDVSGNQELSNRIKSLKESLRKIPNKGIGYGILKYLTLPQNKEELTFNLTPEISFNYLGQFDRDVNTVFFGPSNISAGQPISPNFVTQLSIDINGLVSGQKLILNFTYSKDEYSKETIQKLVESYRKMLVGIIEHCAAKETAEMTPSDISKEVLTFEDIDNIYESLQEIAALNEDF